MDDRTSSRALGFAAAALLLFGAFAPVASIPIVGSVSLMRGPDGWAVLVAAAVLAAVSAKPSRAGLWVCAFILAAAAIGKVLHLQSVLGSLTGIGSAASMSWGVAVILLGVALAFVAAAKAPQL